MASIATPNSPNTTYRNVPPPWVKLPLNSSTIAAIMRIIGSTISAWVHCRAGGAGISGGASSTSSPDGISGAGRRNGRRTTTVDTNVLLACRDRAIVAVRDGVRMPVAGTCRRIHSGNSRRLASNRPQVRSTYEGAAYAGR
jgi:hypothetical protein